MFDNEMPVLVFENLVVGQYGSPDGYLFNFFAPHCEKPKTLFFSHMLEVHHFLACRDARLVMDDQFAPKRIDAEDFLQGRRTIWDEMVEMVPASV